MDGQHFIHDEHVFYLLTYESKWSNITMTFEFLLKT